MDKRHGDGGPGEVVTHASLLRIAVPIMLSNATVPLIGFVDTAVIGQLGEAASDRRRGDRRASSSASSTGPSASCAWARRASPRRRLARATAAKSPGICCGRWPLRSCSALRWSCCSGRSRRRRSGLIGGIARGARRRRAPISTIRIWAAPAGLVNFALLGWFIGLGRAGVAFALQLLLNILNMALAIAVRAVARRGVAGVGFAALIAEVAAAVVGLVVAIRIARQMGAAAPSSDALDWLQARSARSASTPTSRSARSAITPRSSSSPRRVRQPATSRSRPMRC